MSQSQPSICDQYAPFLFHVGQVAIVSGLILGIAMAVGAVIVSLRTPPASAIRDATPTPDSVIDAIKAFIQAISSAPTWIALFGGGILLVWMAAYTTSDLCAH